MIALPQYDRLESIGLWRETPDAQRRDVIVSFGDATLVIADEKSGQAITHWSLPAMIRRNPGKQPAIYAPSEDPSEELELTDDVMIEAIEKVHAVIAAKRPHPGRLRGVLFGLAGVSIVALGVLWLPNALVEHAARVAPMPIRAEIGRQILADMSSLTGTPCRAPAGMAALHALATRLQGPETIIVLPGGINSARRLPGKITVLGRGAIDTVDTPEVAAGQVIAAELTVAQQDPLEKFLQWAGLRAAFTLLTTGALPQEQIRGYGAELLQTSPLRSSDTMLLQAFAQAGVSSTPYAYSLDPSGETVLGLIEADPFKGAPAPTPVLRDAQWVALQDICES
ncbi:hypothetical protein BFP70_00880 [Thioclava sp. SK-1]|uniref:hypothetical protein n=1 Tax=Thioclava sp. SK-1 TaxID=1889770 RepID=UPI0008269AD9|nr:hypothetical protein [Thioclava sp. SK-1]OCX66745.1 hypothetical protein BFP70_00880 [Thioclava sp. SK-1]